MKLRCVSCGEGFTATGRRVVCPRCGLSFDSVQARRRAAAESLLEQLEREAWLAPELRRELRAPLDRHLAELGPVETTDPEEGRPPAPVRRRPPPPPPQALRAARSVPAEKPAAPGWWTRLGPAFAENLLFSLAVFLLVAGAVFSLSTAWTTMSGTARLIALFVGIEVFGGVLQVAARLFDRRGELPEVRRALLLTAALLASLAFVLVGMLHAESAWLGGGAAVLGAAASAFVLRSLGADRRTRLGVIALGLLTAAVPWILDRSFSPRLGLGAAEWLALLAGGIAAGTLWSRAGRSVVASTLLGFAALVPAGFLAVEGAGGVPHRAVALGLVLSALGVVALRDALHRPSDQETRRTTLGLVACALVISAGFFAAANATALLLCSATATAVLLRVAIGEGRRLALLAAMVSSVVAYFLLPAPVRELAIELRDRSSQMLGYDDGRKLPLSFYGLTFVPYVVAVGALARGLRARGRDLAARWMAHWATLVGVSLCVASIALGRDLRAPTLVLFAQGAVLLLLGRMLAHRVCIASGLLAGLGGAACFAQWRDLPFAEILVLFAGLAVLARLGTGSLPQTLEGRILAGDHRAASTLAFFGGLILAMNLDPRGLVFPAVGDLSWFAMAAGMLAVLGARGLYGAAGWSGALWIRGCLGLFHDGATWPDAIPASLGLSAAAPSGVLSPLVPGVLAVASLVPLLLARRTMFRSTAVTALGLAFVVSLPAMVEFKLHPLPCGWLPGGLLGLSLLALGAGWRLRASSLATLAMAGLAFVALASGWLLDQRWWSPAGGALLATVTLFGALMLRLPASSRPSPPLRRPGDRERPPLTEGLRVPLWVIGAGTLLVLVLPRDFAAELSPGGAAARDLALACLALFVAAFVVPRGAAGWGLRGPLRVFGALALALLPLAGMDTVDASPQWLAASLLVGAVLVAAVFRGTVGAVVLSLSLATAVAAGWASTAALAQHPASPALRLSVALALPVVGGLLLRRRPSLQGLVVVLTSVSALLLVLAHFEGAAGQADSLLGILQRWSPAVVLAVATSLLLTARRTERRAPARGPGFALLFGALSLCVAIGCLLMNALESGQLIAEFRGARPDSDLPALAALIAFVGLVSAMVPRLPPAGGAVLMQGALLLVAYAFPLLSAGRPPAWDLSAWAEHVLDGGGRRGSLPFLECALLAVVQAFSRARAATWISGATAALALGFTDLDLVRLGTPLTFALVSMVPAIRGARGGRAVHAFLHAMATALAACVCLAHFRDSAEDLAVSGPVAYPAVLALVAGLFLVLAERADGRGRASVGRASSIGAGVVQAFALLILLPSRLGPDPGRANLLCAALVAAVPTVLALARRGRTPPTRRSHLAVASLVVVGVWWDRHTDLFAIFDGHAGLALALLGAGVAFLGSWRFLGRETFPGRGLRGLPPLALDGLLLQSAALIPLVQGHFGRASGTLLLSASTFAYLGLVLRRRLLIGGALLLANASLFALWLDQGFVDPAFYGIPAGLSLMLGAETSRRSMGEGPRRALSVVGAVLCFGSVLPPVFELGDPVRALALFGAALAALALGFWRRRDDLLLLGAAVSILDVIAYLVAHSFERDFLGSSLLIGAGISVLAAATVASRRRRTQAAAAAKGPAGEPPAAETESGAAEPEEDPEP